MRVVKFHLQMYMKFNNIFNSAILIFNGHNSKLYFCQENVLKRLSQTVSVLCIDW